MNIYAIWLVMVIAWNFGYPQASPLEDVIVAVILSLFSSVLKKYLTTLYYFFNVSYHYKNNKKYDSYL